MDLQSFCVENRRKVHSFPFLRSAVQSTEKMSKSFQFGVPVSGPMMEENCFKSIPNISCNAQITFQGVTKNQDCHSKKTCFDHFNKFSHFTFTRVVGGFVGSKSQGGSASREPHQVWDVILRQLVDTACEATMNNNAQQYFSIGEAVSQTLFGQFNDRKNSTLDFTSFLFARPCDFFANKKPGNMPSSSHKHCQVNSENVTADAQVKFSEVPCDAQSHINIEKNKDTRKTDMKQLTCKQSYAEVARTLATKPDFVYKSGRCQSIPSSSTPINTMVKHRYPRKGNEKCNKKSSRLNGNCYIQPSYNHSSQNQQHKKSMLHDKYEEHIPSKFARDTSSHLQHFRAENSSTCKLRAKETSHAHSIPAKDSKGQEEKKRKYNKFRNPNMREKERKNIDLQVQDDIVYACNMPEHMCQNWRCDHNRMSVVHRGREGFVNQRRDSSVKKYKQQSRLHSPPPRTVLPNSDTINKPEDLKKEASDISEVRNIHEEILCNNEKSTICFSSNLSRSGDDSGESSVSSSPTCIPVVLPLRQRVASECSIDSEDFIVFEEDSHDLIETRNDNGLDSDSCSDYSSSCDSDEDYDEVDFSRDIIPSEGINTNITESLHANAFISVDNRLKCINSKWHEENEENAVLPKTENADFSEDLIPTDDINSNIIESTNADAFIPVAERLKDVNAKWHEETAVLPNAEKVAEKVHFPCTEKLTKVHQMIHWPFAYREARRGPWEQIGRDNDRFQARIKRAERELCQVLDSEHRRRIWEERMCDVGST